jgi:hypothetical protein
VVSTQYYYLVASLPWLTFSAPAVMTKNDFIAECRRQLLPDDLIELEALLDGRRADVKTTFSCTWLDGDTQLRNAIVRQRALRLGVEEKKFLKPHDGFRVDAEAAVNDAYSRANPLERELALDRFRWKLAEELFARDPFGLPAVLAYGVMLAINEHWRSLTPELGKDRLEDLVGMVGVSADEVAGWGGVL